MNPLESQITSPISKTNAWILASRPKTLPAAAAPVIIGAGIAFYEGYFQWAPSLAALIAALLLQIGANLANDVFDYHKGADNANRLGPMRVTQAGLLTPGEVLAGMWITFGIAAAIGLYLIWLAGWPVLIIGVSAILAAVAYTGGPFPLGYYGLGELFVFIFFGPVATCGTYYIQALAINPLAAWSSILPGLLISAILVVNNLRDIPTDRAAGKKTLAVRMGVRVSRIEYFSLVTAAYVAMVLFSLASLASWWVCLAVLSLPLAVSLVRKVWWVSGKELNPVLAGTGRLALLFGVLYALGLVVASLLS